MLAGVFSHVATSMRCELAHFDNAQSAHAPLLQSFKDLRATLDSAHSLASVDSLTFVRPFLDVVQVSACRGRLALNGTKQIFK